MAPGTNSRNSPKIRRRGGAFIGHHCSRVVALAICGIRPSMAGQAVVDSRLEASLATTKHAHVRIFPGDNVPAPRRDRSAHYGATVLRLPHCGIFAPLRLQTPR